MLQDANAVINAIGKEDPFKRLTGETQEKNRGRFVFSFVMFHLVLIGVCIVIFETRGRSASGRFCLRCCMLGRSHLRRQKRKLIWIY